MIHHLVMWEEEQIGFGAFNGFFIIPICNEKWAVNGMFKDTGGRTKTDMEER